MATDDGAGTEGLKLYNSFSRKVEPFVPRDPAGRRVTWYSCGPTVYDASHMGHARSYISFDIMRRVLRDYFGYDVFFVMNVTDIDDKIIKRGRVEALYSEYCSKAILQNVTDDLGCAIDQYVLATLQEKDQEKKNMREKILDRTRQVIAEVEAKNGSEGALGLLLEGARDILWEYLDKIRDPNKVLANDVFATFARKWEEEFFQDMEALNVLPPDVLTRVSEYVPEIVEFIEGIISNGFAYESNGSVYFDVPKYRGTKGHTYAKLVPEAVGDEAALAEGEGELSTGLKGEKRNPADFALWKASKGGEPSWASPWGKGRPGWHIECSAMASAILGNKIDIHTGGVDLKFPHHDNEIAQSEAFFNSDDWVKYFLHSGHLTIAGCKMSKSLKNFITIRDALNEYSAAQLRLTFLLHGWKETLDYSPSGMAPALDLDKKLKEFFLNVKDALRSSSVEYPKWEESDLSLQASLDESSLSVHSALSENLDTRAALFALRELVSAANINMQCRKGQGLPLNGPLLRRTAAYVSRILRVFGVIPDNQLNAFGFPTEGNEGAVDVEGVVMPYLEVLSSFRETVRLASRNIVDPTIKSTILKACDDIRDRSLPALGVRLEDHEGSGTVVKYVGRAEMEREAKQRAQVDAERYAEKLRKKDEVARLAAEKNKIRRTPPTELFRSETDKYSAFREDGLPTHDAAGNPITKSQQKKLEKVLSEHKKKYDEYLKSCSQLL